MPRDLGISRRNLTDEVTFILELREIGSCPSRRELITCLHGYLQSTECRQIHNQELKAPTASSPKAQPESRC